MACPNISLGGLSPSGALWWGDPGPRTRRVSPESRGVRRAAGVSRRRGGAVEASGHTLRIAPFPPSPPIFLPLEYFHTFSMFHFPFVTQMVDLWHMQMRSCKVVEGSAGQNLAFCSSLPLILLTGLRILHVLPLWIEVEHQQHRGRLPGRVEYCEIVSLQSLRRSD